MRLVHTRKRGHSLSTGPSAAPARLRLTGRLIPIAGAASRLLISGATIPPKRRILLKRVDNRVVQAFWREEFYRYSWRFRAIVLAPLLNKVGAFLVDPRVRRILSVGKSSFDLKRIMDSGGILLVNLSKGRCGEGSG